MSIKKIKVLLIIGPASHRQGWGDEKTTRLIYQTLKASGKSVKIISVTNRNDLLNFLHQETFDIVWSSIYYCACNSTINGMPPTDQWIAEILSEKKINYVGSNAETIKTAHSKVATRNFLSAKGIPVPYQNIICIGEAFPDIWFPAFVKPCYESESIGISENSVVDSVDALKERVSYVHQNFQQPAIVEEYLPGREFTVPVLGNGEERMILPAENIINALAYKKYPILMENQKKDQMIEMKVINSKYVAAELALRTADAMACLDHVRVDMREDSKGRLKVMEVNVNPGLDFEKSRSLKIFKLCNPTIEMNECYQQLINMILNSAIKRVLFYV